MTMLSASQVLTPNNKPSWVSGDLNEAHAHLSDVFWPHELDVISPNKALHVCHNMATLGSIPFNTVSYGSAVTTRIIDPFPRSYIFVFTLAGVLEYREGNGVIRSVPDTVLVMNPNVQSHSHISSDHIQLSIKLDDQVLHQYLEREFNIHVRRPLLFATDAISVSKQAERLGSLLNMITQNLNHSCNEQLNPSVTKHLELALIGTLLTELPHNYRNVIDNVKSGSSIPRYVRLAQDYIHANARDAITINTLSNITNITTRALQAGFRRHLELTPMQYIRDCRLDITHIELENATASGANITEIAFNCGFNDLSKYARYYRARFGVNPSDTIRKGFAAKDSGI